MFNPINYKESFNYIYIVIPNIFKSFKVAYISILYSIVRAILYSIKKYSIKKRIIIKKEKEIEVFKLKS